MTHLPPPLAALAAQLDALPAAEQAAFQYCLALMMVEAGEARLRQAIPGEDWSLITFETTAGDVFTVARPPLSEAAEAGVREVIRQILDEEGGGAE